MARRLGVSRSAAGTSKGNARRCASGPVNCASSILTLTSPKGRSRKSLMMWRIKKKNLKSLKRETFGIFIYILTLLSVLFRVSVVL